MGIQDKIRLAKSEGTKQLAVLIDPEKSKTQRLDLLVELANIHDVDYFFIGGSLLLEDRLDQTVRFIKRNSNIPVILFPGNEMQIHPDADALLYLSLISGRNAEYLIGKHVNSAYKIKKMGIEVISTSYLLIHGSAPSTASYISHTQPIPYNKPELATATALAGEMLGHHMTYLEGGSGTSIPIPSETITMVSKSIDHPVIVGGGIRNAKKLKENYIAGADIQVIGTAFERDPMLLAQFADVKKSINNQCAEHER